ncbi:hypothetical protein [Verminephrobacter aporrectodeae]|uniref:hypothetical protein n=1 Tax=Verminephrobacter aporrectodeae TaxID=1110389 RepID=UPI00223705BC|nr:hypothetical protein [Verminephrobacter aporrectodeae]
MDTPTTRDAWLENVTGHSFGKLSKKQVKKLREIINEKCIRSATKRCMRRAIISIEQYKCIIISEEDAVSDVVFYKRQYIHVCDLDEIENENDANFIDDNFGFFE